MHLGELLDFRIADIGIVEGFGYSEIDPIIHYLLCEEKVTVASFEYEKAKNDKKPRVLVLGRWQHPGTGNFLVCGINLHYLNAEQIKTLKEILPNIMVKDSTKARFWEGMSLAPDIFKTAYRTYDERYVYKVDKSMIDIPGYQPEPAQQQIEPLSKPDKEELPDRPLGKGVPEPKASKIKMPKVPVPKAPGAPPEIPKPATGMIGKTKDLISKLSNLVKSKLHKNAPIDKGVPGAKEQKPVQPKVATKEPSPVPEIPAPAAIPPQHEPLQPHPGSDDEVEKEIHDLDELERTERVLDQASPDHDDLGEPPAPMGPEDEISELEKLEGEHDEGIDDEGLGEGFEAQVDAILEQLVVKPRGTWSTPSEYVELHHPDSFFDFDARLGTTVLECANGSQFCALYHIPTDRMIIDLTDNYFDMLTEADWNLADTIRIPIRDGKIIVECDNREGGPIAEAITKSNFGKFLNSLID